MSSGNVVRDDLWDPDWGSKCLDGPDWSGVDFTTADITIADAKAARELPDDEIAPYLAGKLGLVGAGLALRFRTGEQLPVDASDRQALYGKYGFNHRSAFDNRPRSMIIDVRPMPAPGRGERIAHALGAGLRWFAGAPRKAPLQEEHARIVGMLFN
jgi:hypothetical protein